MLKIVAEFGPASGYSVRPDQVDWWASVDPDSRFPAADEDAAEALVVRHLGDWGEDTFKAWVDEGEWNHPPRLFAIPWEHPPVKENTVIDGIFHEGAKQD
jgi:hypothetical protein